ncbi:MAG: CcmD family protein [Chitinophagales bacterium]
MKKHLSFLVLMFFSVISYAQGETNNNDFFRSSLKIYVAVAVLVIILGCIFAFLWALEKRLKKLEQQ